MCVYIFFKSLPKWKVVKWKAFGMKSNYYILLSHHWHVFKPLEIWPRRLDEFDGENHQHEHQDDAEDAYDSHKAGTRWQVAFSWPCWEKYHSILRDWQLVSDVVKWPRCQFDRAKFLMCSYDMALTWVCGVNTAGCDVVWRRWRGSNCRPPADCVIGRLIGRGRRQRVSR